VNWPAQRVESLSYLPITEKQSEDPTMKTLTLATALSIFILIFASGCATTGAMRGVPAQDRQMREIYAASGLKSIYFIAVPSPANVISEKLMAASLAFGSSTAIDALVEVFSKGNPVTIGVIGESDAINAATVKVTLEHLKNKRAAGTLYLVADTKTRDELHDLAQTAGIKLIVLPLK